MTRTMQVYLIVFLVCFNIVLIFPGIAAYVITPVGLAGFVVIGRETVTMMPKMMKFWSGEIKTAQIRPRGRRIETIFLALFALTIAHGFFRIYLSEKDLTVTLPDRMTFETTDIGTVLLSRPVSPSDAVYDRLKTLLAEEQHGWERNFVTRVPGLYVFRADRIDINCYADSIVIDYVEGGEPYSLTKSVPGVFDRLGLPVIDPQSPKKN